MTAELQTRPRRFPWWIYVVLLVVILLLALSPVISVIIAGSIAEANGCNLNEGTINPCMVNGTDWGSTLYMLFVLGWFMIATVPLGAMAILVLLVVCILHRVLWGRANRKATA